MKINTRYPSLVTLSLIFAFCIFAIGAFVFSCGRGVDETVVPSVESTSPTSDATSVSVTSSITATFSKDMDSLTLTASTFIITSDAGAAVDGTITYSSSAKTVTLVPSSNLSYEKKYTATITTGAKDTAGIPLASAYSWNFNTKAPDLRAIYGAMAVGAVAVGKGGAIARISNNAVSKVTSGTTNDLYAVSFSGGNTGWAVGANGTILKSGDYGVSWNSQTSGITETLYGVVATFSLTATSTACAVGANGTILLTTDGGSTWVSKNNSGVSKDLYAITASGSTYYWAVGAGGTILISDDSGNTWIPNDSGTTLDLLGVHFTGNICKVVGVGGTILTKSGFTWTNRTAYNSGIALTLNSVRFVGMEGHGWAVGNDGIILTSVDSGETWIAQDSGTNNILYGVTVVSSTSAIAVGANATGLRYNGTSWSKVTK